MDVQVKRIIKALSCKKLPLNKHDLGVATNFCEDQESKKNLIVLGKTPKILTQDWLTHPGNPKAAMGHIDVCPEQWRRTMEHQCDIVIGKFLELYGSENTISLLMWRAALAFANSLFYQNVPMLHMDVKRGGTLDITSPMPLSNNDRKSIGNHSGKIVIPDPMLASGSSNAFVIELLKQLGIRNDQIVLLSIVSAPEGIYRIFNTYPGIKIIAAALHEKLNKEAYIIGTGLGDAGDKFFYKIVLEYFQPILDSLSPRQRLHLTNLIEQANA